MSDEEKAKVLIEWVARNAEKESAFLSPVPSWSLNANDLIDKIRELWGISEGTVIELCFKAGNPPVEVKTNPPIIQTIAQPITPAPVWQPRTFTES